MRTKVTLVLILLNVVLFYYIFYHLQPELEGRKILEARRRVFGPEVATIDSFTRAERSAPTVRIEKRSDGSWFLTQPYEWPANMNAVARILNELQFLDHESSWLVADQERSGRSLADYGLADPAITFTFSSVGKNYTTLLGDVTQVGNRLYLLSPDAQRIHVVGRSLLDSLGLPLEQLRSPSIFTVPVFEVRSLNLQGNATAGAKIRLRRDGSRWTFDAPIIARANKPAVEESINALNGLETKKFLEAREADADRTGLANPTLQITFEGNARRETLLLGNPVAATPPAENAPVEYYAKMDDKPVVFTTLVPSKLFQDLRTAQEKFRDAHILDFDPRNVTTLTLAAPDQPELSLQFAEAAQGAGSWLLIHRAAAGQTATAPIPADSALVVELLQKLTQFSATKFLSDAPSNADVENYGFNRPERVITLNLNTGGGPSGSDPTTLVLEVGVKPGDRSVAYARVQNAPFIYQVDPGILEFTPMESRHYRQRLLRELPEGARITGLKLVDQSSNTLVFEATNPDALTAETIGTPSVPEKNRAALAMLLAQMRSLRAKQFVTDSFNPDHAEQNGTAQPWKYRLDVTMALTGGNGAAQTPTTTLLLTQRLGGTTQIAGTTEFGGITFELTQELVDALFILTYGEKHDPGPPPAEKPAPTEETAKPKS